MKSMVKKAIREEEGKMMIMVLVLLVVGGLVLAPLLGLMSTGLAAGQVYENKAMELYAADAGVEDAIWKLQNPDQAGLLDDCGKKLSLPYGYEILQINGTIVNVTIAVHGSPKDHTYEITSTAIGEGHGTTVVSVVKVPPQFNRYVVEGNMALRANDTITEDTVIVIGDVTLQQNSSLTVSDLYIDGNLHLEQHTTVTADVICITGNLTLANNTEINADLHFLEDNCVLTISQPSSTVRGNILAEGNLKIAIAQGNAAGAEVEGHVYAPRGDVRVHLNANNSELKGDIYAAGSIVVTKGHTGATHTGSVHSGYTGAPPFEVAPCPELPGAGSLVVITYEVS